MKKSLTIDEKVAYTSGINMWELYGKDEFSDHPVRLSDGPSGVRYVDINSTNDLSVDNSAHCFLSPSSASYTFNVELLYELGTALGMEARKHNIDILLAPGINIKRTPLCGRNFEYFSEDPYLTGLLSSALINGIQSNNVGVCLKHLCCNNQETYRYTNSSIVDERTLNEIYLYPFRIAIEKTNPISIMTSYNKLNNEYVSENKDLLDKIRNEYKFKGLFISDWGGINDPVRALKAGLNIEMPKNTHSKKMIKEAYENGVISKEELDNNVQLIENAYKIISENRKKEVNIDEERINEIIYKVASESPVLLKNKNNVLPLKEDDDILVVGDLFNNPNTQGYGSSRINYKTKVSFKDEFKKFTKLHFHPGYSRSGNNITFKFDCVKEAKKYDKIVLFMGYYYGDAEGIDRTDISLPREQLELLYELLRLNKKIIVVLNTGGAVELPFAKNVDAILQSGLLGEIHQKVITEILFGKINPSGKLSETYPLNSKDNPFIKDIHKNNDLTYYKETLFIGYHYYDTFKKDVAFPFGHGLSYSSFKYTSLNIIKEDEHRFQVSFNVENISNIEGSEVCQVYLRRKNSKTYVPYQQLKGFKKVTIKPHEKVNVNLILEEHCFELYNDNSHQFEIETGIYEICVGSSSRDISLVNFIEIKGNETLFRFQDLNISSYYNLKAIERFALEKLLNFEVKQVNHYPYSMNTPVNFIRKKQLGKIVYRMIKKQYLKEYGYLPIDVATETLQYVPFRMLISLSNETVKYDFIDNVIFALNENFFKGALHLYKYMKGNK